MPSRSTLVVVVLLAGALGPQLLAAQCPISPATQQVNFRGVAAACGTNSADETADPCEGCLCSLIAAFGPALTASTTAAPGTVIQACVTAYITPITAAGVNVFDLTGVQSCPLTPAVIQQCQGPANATAVPVPLSNATAPGGVAVAPGVKPTASPAIANNTLRINPGSIEITPTGPTFRVSGTITNPSHLLKLMLNNTELVSTLDPTELSLLRSLYGQLATVQPTPRVQRAFAAIVDITQPIPAVELMTKVQELLGSLADEGLLAPPPSLEDNSTLGMNDTTGGLNGTGSGGLNSSGSDTVVVQRNNNPLSSPEGGTSMGRLNPVRSAGNAAGVATAAGGVTMAVASLAGLLLTGLFVL